MRTRIRGRHVTDARGLIGPPVDMRDYNNESVMYEFAVAMCEEARQQNSGAGMEEGTDRYLARQLKKVR